MPEGRQIVRASGSSDGTLSRWQAFRPVSLQECKKAGLQECWEAGTPAMRISCDPGR
ncbi:hypothetical protein [Flavobacterium sp.]|uniref:hypothetical protein n=1 Tax=Flavobacterium sp. TaxID=239 RepID=UPI004033FF0F